MEFRNIRGHSSQYTDSLFVCGRWPIFSRNESVRNEFGADVEDETKKVPEAQDECWATGKTGLESGFGDLDYNATFAKARGLFNKLAIAV